ncbi:MAG TPA: hypothetical protein VFF70_07350, partial [Anaerolineae bacterium]|nr:hypothetical protein [Anaerolineae bacterium]
FNVFASAVPFAEKMIAAESGSIFRTVIDESIEIGKALVRLPGQIDHLTDVLLRGELRFTVNDTDKLIKEMHNMNRSMIRLQWTLISLGLLFTSIVLDVGGYKNVSPIVLAAAIVAGVWFFVRGVLQ